VNDFFIAATTCLCSPVQPDNASRCAVSLFLGGSPVPSHSVCSEFA
jgi:hypothetical protein